VGDVRQPASPYSDGGISRLVKMRKMKSYPAEEMVNLRDPASIQARKPLLVAHRGGMIAPDAPENSLAAIRLAASQGYDMVELDVREAKDQEPVLFHGRGGGGGLLVDCGVERDIESLTSDELAAIYYRASNEPIATLAQALALCQSLNLAVMLDIKTDAPSETFFQRIAELLEAHELGSATVAITYHPLIHEYLADLVIPPVSEQDSQRVYNGETLSLRGQFWFGWAVRLPDAAVSFLQRSGAFVIPAINTFHYPVHAHYELARQDAQRLLAAGADGFQIDSVYADIFLESDEG
jgi:hypothetical protein